LGRRFFARGSSLRPRLTQAARPGSQVTISIAQWPVGGFVEGAGVFFGFVSMTTIQAFNPAKLLGIYFLREVPETAVGRTGGCVQGVPDQSISKTSQKRHARMTKNHFFATDLEVILRHRGITQLIVTGVTTEVCFARLRVISNLAETCL